MNIKGEYVINIKIQNMFNTYDFTTTKHNVVTEKGLELIMKCALNRSDEYLGNVRVGTNDTEATISDTATTYPMSTTLPIDEDEPQIIGNAILYNINTDGSKLNLTTEIGIFGTDGTLITRDVHDTFDIPSSAIINIKYSLTLTNINNEELEEEEDVLLND